MNRMSSLSFNGTEGAKMVFTTPDQLHPESKLCTYVEENQLQAAGVVVDEGHVIRDWEEFRSDLHVHADDEMHEHRVKQEICEGCTMQGGGT
jgi:superfamily II DNA helicase RecQ